MLEDDVRSPPLQSMQPSADRPRMEYPELLGLSNASWDIEQTTESLGAATESDKIKSRSSSEENCSWDSKNSSEDTLVKSDGTSSGKGTSPTRRGPFRDPSDRAETAQTRKLTACLRCRMQRIRVVAL